MLENKNCKVLANSINPYGCRLTTILFKRFPYNLLQEIATHRLNAASAITPFPQDMSRNSASTRAIPLKKLIEQVKADPFIPTFELNKRGMTGDRIEDLQFQGALKNQWLMDMHDTIDKVTLYETMEVHKSKPAKLLIPWLRIPIIVSSTNWPHFFDLRCNENADIDLQDQAYDALELWTSNEPKKLEASDWHIPFQAADFDGSYSTENILKASAANVARVSYTTHEGNIDFEANIRLAETLIADKHFSPFEHIAQASDDDEKHRNFEGFVQYREILEKKSVGF